MGSTTTLAEALPAQIARVAAKRERWIAYQIKMNDDRAGSGDGMGLTIALMKAHVDAGLAALGSGDIAKMIAAHQDLACYSDDD